MRVLGINAISHDPAAALVVDGQIVAAAEEERFSRRKHGKRPVPFSAWELPEQAARWCLDYAALDIGDLDAVAYSYDPALTQPAAELGLDDPWDHVRTTYALHAPSFLADADQTAAALAMAGGVALSRGFAAVADPLADDQVVGRSKDAVIADPQWARQAGKAARQAALGRYSLARFHADWNRVFEEVTR